jgi:hypothetical protein
MRGSSSGIWTALDAGIDFNMMNRVAISPGMIEIASSGPPIRLAGPGAVYAGVLIAYFVYGGNMRAAPGLEQVLQV